MKHSIISALCLLLLPIAPVNADPLILPLQLDYALIKKVVVSQLFTGNGQSAQLWRDKHDCSHLTLSNPQIGGQNGQIRLLNNVDAQFGTHFGGQCIPVLKWEGVLETLQKPTLNADNSILSLPVTQAFAYDKQGRKLEIAQLQDLLKKAAEPRLAGLNIDLNKSRADIERNVSRFVPQNRHNELKAALASLKFNAAAANDDNVVVKLAFDMPTKNAAVPATAAFTDKEQAQSQAVWQEWQAFVTKIIGQASKDSESAELRGTLADILSDSKKAFHAGLTTRNADNEDPIRAFFADTWEKLGPVLHTLAQKLPEAKSLQYLTFIAATDVMYQLDAIGAPFGLGISSDGLRNLVRMLIADKQRTQTENKQP